MKPMRRIKIERKRSKMAWGLAYPEEHRIVIDPDLVGKDLLEIGCHETAHVVCPYLDEATIDLLGKQLADVLWRIGFRREDDNDEHER